MIEAFENKFGVTAVQGWGMTEMSPVGTIGTLKRKLSGLPRPQQQAIKLKQGRAIYGVDLKIVDAEGKVQPHDGVAMGELLVRGPWIIGAYYNDKSASREAFDAEGWLRTGDVDTPLHTHRIGAHPPVGGVRHVELIDQGVGSQLRMFAPHAAQPPEQHQVLPSGELPIERGELSGGPDVRAYLGGLSDDVIARHDRLPGGGPQQRGQDFDRGRFTGAVMAENRADRPGGNRKGHVLQCVNGSVERLGYAMELDHGSDTTVS